MVKRESGAAVDVILLVDADPSHIRLVRRAFEKEGAASRIEVARSLAEARRRIAARSPDLVIVDLDLPDGRGTELIAPGNPDYAVVAMASRGDEQLVVEVLKRGALEYVVKDVERLLDMPRIADRALREWRHIVEYRRAVEALRESEARYRALTDHADSLIAEIDESGTVVFASPNHAEIVGFEPEALIGTNAAERIHPDDMARAVAVMEKLTTPDVSVQEAFRYRTNQGTWRWIETIARSYRTAADEHRVVFSSRDVTDRRELEERLRQSQKLEAVGQLAGGIAHDFNNLLTVISGYAEHLVDVLESGTDPHDAAQQIADAARRSSALTRQLLAFSRAQVLEPSTLDLNEIITDLGKMLARLIGSDIRLELDLDPEVGAIEMDRGQIEQVIVNLAVNARDAMGSGGRLAISTRRHDDGFVRLRVQDTGHGMDDATRERIFEPFFTTKQVGKGTGQGLSTVYGILHQSGGSISVASEPGRGSTFDILLPVAGAAAPAIERTASPSTAPLDHHGSILLVEDESEIRRLLVRYLERAGYRVTSAASGEDALNAVRADDAAFDLLLTDIVMPGIDGIELAERLRRRWPALPVIFMSGYTERQVSGRARALPEHAKVIDKPFRMVDLAATIRSALDLA